MTTQLGLPDDIQACLFDLDGVVTRTAVVHAAAWKETFDAFLRGRDGADFRPFTDSDYDQYVDGRPRADGVRSFLASRGVELPEGTPDDPPDARTVNGVGNRKNELLLEKIRTDGVEPYRGRRLRYIDTVRAAGLATAIVSSSANTRDVLHSIDAERLFDVRIDGVVARERTCRANHTTHLLAAARDLGVEPSRAAVFEDALAGMDAGRSGHFGYVVGVDRVGQTDALYAHGADRVVKDLAELGDHA
ncbi:Beta-phosphoglucomutase family hydrolase OS=Streptomyces tendae OX=1932 GN=GUR47_04815 PE=4 SV=1 [Streptomyces tendae]